MERIRINLLPDHESVYQASFKTRWPKGSYYLCELACRLQAASAPQVVLTKPQREALRDLTRRLRGI